MSHSAMCCYLASSHHLGLDYSPLSMFYSNQPVCLLLFKYYRTWNAACMFCKWDVLRVFFISYHHRIDVQVCINKIFMAAVCFRITQLCWCIQSCFDSGVCQVRLTLQKMQKRTNPHVSDVVNRVVHTFLSVTLSLSLSHTLSFALFLVIVFTCASECSPLAAFYWSPSLIRRLVRANQWKGINMTFLSFIIDANVSPPLNTPLSSLFCQRTISM